MLIVTRQWLINGFDESKHHKLQKGLKIHLKQSLLAGLFCTDVYGVVFMISVPPRVFMYQICTEIYFPMC